MGHNGGNTKTAGSELAVNSYHPSSSAYLGICWCHRVFLAFPFSRLPSPGISSLHERLMADISPTLYSTLHRVRSHMFAYLRYLKPSKVKIVPFVLWTTPSSTSFTCLWHPSFLGCKAGNKRAEWLCAKGSNCVQQNQPKDLLSVLNPTHQEGH